jgi:hypothetical protein
MRVRECFRAPARFPENHNSAVPTLQPEQAINFAHKPPIELAYEMHDEGRQVLLDRSQWRGFDADDVNGGSYKTEFLLINIGTPAPQLSTFDTNGKLMSIQQ